MPNNYRRDDYVQDAMGNAISGAGVYVTSQPAQPGYYDSVGYFVPPSPQVQLYADSGGAVPITQPVQSDGYGHAFYYLSPQIVTVFYYSPQIVTVELTDQLVGTVMSTPVPVNQQQPAGAVNGSNQQYTISSVPSTSFLQVFLNGVLQIPAVNFSFNGLTIFMNIAPSVGDKLYVFYQ